MPLPSRSISTLSRNSDKEVTPMRAFAAPVKRNCPLLGKLWEMLSNTNCDAVMISTKPSTESNTRPLIVSAYEEGESKLSYTSTKTRFSVLAIPPPILSRVTMLAVSVSVLVATLS